jgi:selenocysteine-specific elongation factor
VILGTAGHVDHGKTALVHALTGVDTDRLPEEQRRGITIELGFAPLALEDAGTVGVVDVPGHEAFVRTMLAGATGVDLALLVVAADEGVMPQTREHLAILTLLGVGGGVVALTKSDLVEDEWLELVAADVRALLVGSPLERAAIIPCSARTGAGLTDLRAALAAAARAVPVRNASDLVRLPVDRIFTVRGTGTVVTGTLWSGTLAADSAVRLLPSGQPARVRALETHGAKVERALPGSRVAVALGGIDRTDVQRGEVLVCDGDPWFPSRVLRADVALLADAPPLGVRTRVRFHLGTVEVGARVVAAGGRLQAGATTGVVPVRLALDEVVVARTGDRFVLRAASPTVTIGGGVVTDARPPARRAKPWPSANANASTRLEWIVGECGGAGLALHDVPNRLGVAPNDVDATVSRAKAVARVADRLYSRSLREELTKQLTLRVKARHRTNPLEPGLSLQEAREQLKATDELFSDLVRDLVATHVLELRGAVISVAGWKPASAAGDAKELDGLNALLSQAGSQPPSVSELTATFGPRTPTFLRVLEREGRAVAVAPDRYFASAALAELISTLRDQCADGVPRTASQIKDLLGLTRKYLIPLLQYTDRTGVTNRTGDLRTVRPARE